MIFWFLPIASLTVCGFTYAFALGKDVSIDMTIRVLLGIVLPVTLFIAFAPIIYSYVYYRKQLKAGTAA